MGGGVICIHGKAQSKPVLRPGVLAVCDFRENS